MGPICTSWHDARNTTEQWCGGRIDIYGLDSEQYWGGCFEYSLPIMDERSWVLLSDWLDSYVTRELVSLDQLLDDFTRETRHKITWADEVLSIQPEGTQDAFTNT